jgi:hypothetical protein
VTTLSLPLKPMGREASWKPALTFTSGSPPGTGGKLAQFRAELEFLSADRPGSRLRQQGNDRGANPDARAAAGGDHRRVTNTRLIIELDAGVLPVGRVLGPDGRGIRFAGWTELAAALEQAREMVEEREDDVGPSALPGRASHR